MHIIYTVQGTEWPAGIRKGDGDDLSYPSLIINLLQLRMYILHTWYLFLHCTALIHILA